MSTPDLPEELANRLGEAADAIDHGDSTAVLAQVRGTAARRRRRRQAAVGVAAVGALAASGLVIANITGDNGDELIVSAPATDPVDSNGEGGEEEAVEPPVETVGESTGSTPPTGSALVPVTASMSEGVVDDALAIDQQNASDTQLYPWNGGFLAVHTQFLPQPLPTELPPEIAEQFPQEVLDLFPDGLPPTIDEATEILQDAGLYDVVADIVVSNPDVSAAIYSGRSERMTTVRFSPDGIEWRDIEMDLPVDSDRLSSFASTGDRFVVVSAVTGASPSDTVQDPSVVEVWSSTDLVSWEPQIVSLAAPRSDLPDFVRTETFVTSVVANDNGWMVSVGSFTQVDPMALLDEEQTARAQEGGGFGTSQSEDGVVVEIYPSGPAGDGEVEQIEFTWEELGVTEPPEDEQTTVAYTARWGGDVRESESGVAGTFGFANVVALDDGFAAFGTDLRLSPDGLEWSTVELPDGGGVEWVIETDAGLIASGFDDEGTRFEVLFDTATSTFVPIELGDVPDQVGAEQRGRYHVTLTDYGDDQVDPFGPFGSSAVVEANGYRFELEVRFGGEVESVSYVLTELETGDVVSTESLDPTEGAEFEFAKEEYDIPDQLEGFRVFDPETGEELMAVPFEDFTYVQLDRDGEPIAGSEFDAFVEAVPSERTSWLVAAIGDSLMIEQIEGSSGETYLSSVAVQGDIALIARSDGSMTRISAAR